MFLTSSCGDFLIMKEIYKVFESIVNQEEKKKREFEKA